MNTKNNEQLDGNHRRLLLRRLMQTAGVMALSRAFMPWWVQAADRLPAPLSAGKSVYDCRGQVTVDGKRVDENTEIRANALIETGSDSYVIFAIGSDAHIVRENSRVQFFNGKAAVSVHEDDPFFVHGLRLLSGKLLSVFGERKSEQPAYQLHTSTATVGIRGTGVYAESDVDVSYVCTCYGTTELRAKTDVNQMERIASRHHDAPRYILANGQQLITPAPFKNHRDEELMLIEALVGRDAPVSSVSGYKSPRKGY